jgi:hypothetical protein
LANPQAPNKHKGEVKKVIPNQQGGQQGLWLAAKF